MIWAGHLALRRLLSQWRSLLTIIAGMLLSACVGALVPLYTTTVAQVSMVEKLNQLPPAEVQARADLSLIASKTPNFTKTLQDTDTKFREITARRLGNPFPGWVNRVVFYGETTQLVVDPPTDTNVAQANPTSRAIVAYYQGWQDGVTLVGGRFPSDNPPESGADIEVAVPLAAQTTLGVALNDVLALDQGGPTGGWPTSKNVLARVVGIVNAPEQMTTLQQAYLMDPSPLRVLNTKGQYQYDYAVLTTQAAFERVAQQFVPDTPTSMGWRLLFDPTRLPFTRSPEARAALTDYDHELNATFGGDPDQQFNYSTGLINWQTGTGGQNADTGALISYEQSVGTLQAPFGLLLLQVGALVLFFMLVTAALVRRGERREIAMLQSRGAEDRQLILIRGAEALVIAIFAALVAPILSQQLLIVTAPIFTRYTNLPLQLSPTVFAYSAVAAATTFLALMFTLRPALRQPLITSGGMTERNDKQPWWQRTYADVVLVILGLAALWRLVGQETPLFTTTAGGRTTDPFLLLAPAFLFLGLGSLLLRLFPAAAAAAARIVAAGRGLIGPLAGWQLSREPLHYGRITFLLALAIGIGWFATSFRATVNRSQSDQAAYQVGADVRFTEQDERLNVARARPEAAYQQIPGVATATVALRRANVNFQANATKDPLPGTLLAVDPSTFGQVSGATWRPDLGTITMPRLPNNPPPLPDRGLALPFQPQKLGVWALFTVRGALALDVPDLDRLRNRTTIYARLLDSSGAWLRVPFKVTHVEYTPTGPQASGLTGGGDFVSDGWAYLEADLSSLAYKPAGPLRMVSLYWQHRGRSQTGERFLHLTLAGLVGTDASGKQQPIDLLSQPGWAFATDSGVTNNSSVSQSFQDDKHGKGLTASWDQGGELVVVGLLLNYPTAPTIPIIVSNSLAAQLALQAGQTLQLRDLERLSVSFQIVGQQQYYPTLYDSTKIDGKYSRDDQSHPFAIVDRDRLLYALNRRPSAALYADEVWIKTTSGVDTSTLLTALRPADHSAVIVSAESISGELATLRTDPLSLGLLGLMFLAFIIATSLSVVGLLTYAALTAAARRNEFGVLRALGMSPLRLVAQLAAEQGFVIVLGALLGGALGTVLSNQVVPRLALDTSSKSITPPFIVQIETGALLQYAGLMAVVLGLVLLVSLVLVSRLSLSRTLRLGEE